MRYALRGLRRTPVFTCAAVASLALVIGVNTSIFSLVNAVLLKRLPVPNPERLVTFAQTYRGQRSEVVWPLQTIDELSKRVHVLSGILGWYTTPISFSTGDTVEWVRSELVSGQYYRTLQVSPAIGRLLNDEDVRDAAANPVCVLSYDFWQRQFGGDPGALGRKVYLNSHAYLVLGVSAKGFYGAELQQQFDVAVPASRAGDFIPGLRDAASMSWLNPMARLKSGITRTEAEQQIQDPSKRAELHVENGGQGFNSMRSGFGQPLLVLMGIVVLVWLTACANLANLQLARAQALRPEFAVRVSLGASRVQIISQPFMESFLLTLSGGVAGVMLSLWVNSSLIAFLNAGRPATSTLHVAPDANVLVFSLILTAATMLLFGLIPVWHATSSNPLTGLKLRAAAGGAPSGVALRRVFIVIQITLSLVIVFGASLLTRTLHTLAAVDLGFQPDHVVVLKIDPAANGRSSADVSNVFDELLTRVRNLPGVEAASLAASTPYDSTSMSTSIEVPGYLPKPVQGDNVVDLDFVSSEYFKTLGQALLHGRDFASQDNENTPPVAIVNEKFARHYFSGRDPMRRAFKVEGENVEIIGIVRDARDHNVRSGPEDMVYMPQKQGPRSALSLLVRAQRSPERLVPSLLASVRSLDRRIPVFSVHSLDMNVKGELSPERILAYLSTLFGLLATLLAGIGLYAVLTYSVVRRTREIGIRVALGAQRRNVAVEFLQEGLLLLLIGLSVGVPLSLLSAQALHSLLFGVVPTDHSALLVSVTILAFTALLATAIPLWRAVHVDPILALRWE